MLLDAIIINEDGSFVKLFFENDQIDNSAFALMNVASLMYKHDDIEIIRKLFNDSKEGKKFNLVLCSNSYVHAEMLGCFIQKCNEKDTVRNLTCKFDKLNVLQTKYKLDMLYTDSPGDFINSFNEISKYIHNWAKGKGFWEEGKDRNDGEMIALFHSELSEALEFLRHGNPASDHIPEFTGVEEELADLIIRIMDTAHAREWKIAEALIEKIKYNNDREYKHGKKF